MIIFKFKRLHKRFVFANYDVMKDLDEEEK